MKFLIASDIHGSAYYTKKLIEQSEKEKVDKVILLGDIYNHGPRNPLPKEYDPMKVADFLNSIKEKLIVIQGNCDSQVDTLISQFDFIPSMCLAVENKTLFLTHGHIYNKDNPTKTHFDAVIYGHFHTCFIKKKEDTTYINCGSVSLPKNNTPNSYALLDGNCLSLKTIDGKEIEKTFL